jgi:EAL domain-containing protein (putative c-di-GMP-specific phosphodiesterase class I)
MMCPNQFPPLAFRSGLIHPLGEWVLANALRQGGVLQRIRPDAEMRIAVNVAVVQFQAGFSSGLAGALEADGFPPRRLAWRSPTTYSTTQRRDRCLPKFASLGCAW